MAAVVNAGCPCVIRYKNGALQSEKVPGEVYAGVTSVGTSTTFGDLAATVGGEIFQRTADWLPLVPSSSTGATPISALTAIDGSLIYADGNGKDGLLGEYGLSYGACPVPDVQVSGRIHSIVPLDGGARLVVMAQLLTIQDPSMGNLHAAPSLVVFDRTPPPACLFDAP
jgi:hypothetical protein